MINLIIEAKYLTFCVFIMILEIISDTEAFMLCTQTIEICSYCKKLRLMVCERREDFIVCVECNLGFIWVCLHFVESNFYDDKWEKKFYDVRNCDT